MKRALYLCAIVCLLGVGVNVHRLLSGPNTVGEAIEAVRDHDPSARADVEAARTPDQEADDAFRNAGIFLCGFCLFAFLAQRKR
jgi:hypothetical protein